MDDRYGNFEFNNDNNSATQPSLGSFEESGNYYPIDELATTSGHNTGFFSQDGFGGFRNGSQENYYNLNQPQEIVSKDGVLVPNGRNVSSFQEFSEPIQHPTQRKPSPGIQQELEATNYNSSSLEKGMNGKKKSSLMIIALVIVLVITLFIALPSVREVVFSNFRYGKEKGEATTLFDDQQLPHPSISVASYYTVEQFQNIQSTNIDTSAVSDWREFKFSPYSKDSFRKNHYNLAYYSDYRAVVSQRERLALFNLGEYEVEAQLYHSDTDVKEVADEMWSLYTREDFSDDGKSSTAKHTIVTDEHYGQVDSRLVCSADPKKEKYCGYEVIFANIRLWFTIPSAGKGSQSEITSYYRKHPPVKLIEQIVESLN